MKYLLLIVVSLALCSCKNVQPEGVDILILNIQLVDLEQELTRPVDVAIKNNRIYKVLPGGSQGSFKAKNTIEGADKFLLPGFWDNHVHFRGGAHLIDANKDFLKLFTLNGITTVRDCGGDLTPSVQNWNDQIIKGALMGPRIFTSGPKIDGPKGTWAGSLSVTSETDINRALDSLESLNVDFVKIYDSRISRAAFLKTVEKASERGLITSGHMPFSVKLFENIDAGIDGIEHLYYVLKGCSSQEELITQAIINGEYGFWDSMSKLMASYDPQVAAQTFAYLKHSEVYVVPTLHIGHTLSYLDEVDHSKDPYLKRMSEGIIDTYQGRIRGALNASASARKRRKRLDSVFVQLTKALHDAEVALLAGSDSGAYNSYVYPGISLHEELEALVDAGLRPAEALRTSATNGARFLKKEEDYGNIKPGKIADLVLLNSNPLKDIRQTRNIYRVITNNQIINPLELAEQLDCMDCLYNR